jgi:hypothetical protein
MMVISSSAEVVTVTSTRSSEICGDSTRSRASASKIEGRRSAINRPMVVNRTMIAISIGRRRSSMRQ